MIHPYTLGGIESFPWSAFVFHTENKQEFSYLCRKNQVAHQQIKYLYSGL